MRTSQRPRDRTVPPRPAAAGGGRRPDRPLDLARLVAAADDLEQALEVLEAAPGTRGAVLAELRRRRPGLDRPSPLSTAVLVRLAGRIGGREGLAELVPFLGDANALVQVEAAEALDVTPWADLREVLGRLAREHPDGSFWAAVIGLLESREERGLGRLALELTERLTGPGALAAVLEALPFLVAPDELAVARRTLRRFLQDTRTVPDAETEDGPLTLALVAAQALETLPEPGSRNEATHEHGER